MKTALIAATLATQVLASGSALGSEQTVLVDITGVPDDAALTRIKHDAGVAWWIEAGEVLVLAGPGASATAERHALPLLRDLGRLDPEELVLHANGCGDNTTPIPEERIVLSGGSYDLVRQPQAFSPLGRMALPSAHRDDLGNAEWRAVAVNTTIARLRRFDRTGDIKQPEVDQTAIIVGRVDPLRWFANVSTLANWNRSSFAPTDLTLARQWIAGQFGSMGLAVDEPFFTMNYNGTVVNIANVVGMFRGVVHPDEWLVVGGHYDSRNPNILSTVNTPGADDNASGCSGVIEAAHAIVDYLPQRSIVFMCYSGEEQGLRGSTAHVNALSGSGDLARINAMLNMDMIGWSPDATLGVIAETRPGDANVALANRLADAALDYVPALDQNHVVVRTDSCCSDHMPYINAGRPGVMSIHRLRASTPFYHQTTDTPANLGPHAQDIGPAIVRMNVAALVQLAGVDLILRADNEPD